MAAFVEIVKLSTTNFHESGYHSIETRSSTKQVQRNDLSEIYFGPIYGLIPIIGRFNFLVSFSLNFARNIIYRRHKSGLRMTSIDW